jgi:hypothetical protein
MMDLVSKRVNENNRNPGDKCWEKNPGEEMLGNKVIYYRVSTISLTLITKTLLQMCKNFIFF